MKEPDEPLFELPDPSPYPNPDLKKFFVTDPNAPDPNENYTGWDLPENPELRAWIESLPPLEDEGFHEIRFFEGDEVVKAHQLLIIGGHEAEIDHLDRAFLAVHAGEHGPDITAIELLGPAIVGVRESIARLEIDR